MMPGIAFRLGRREKALLVQHLAAAAAPGGMPLPQAMRLLRESGLVSGTCARHLARIERQVEAGSSLADALRELPGSFAEWEAALVAGGERAGRLDLALTAWAESLRRRGRLLGAVVPAATYAIGIMAALTFFLVIMLWKITPTLATLHVDSGQPIPFVLRMATGPWDTADAVMVCVLTAVGLLVFLAGVIRWRPARRFTDMLLRWTPVVGRLRTMSARWLMLDALATHALAGLPLHAGLAQSASAMASQAHASELEAAARAVAAGGNMARRRRGVLDARTAGALTRALAGPEPAAAMRRLADDASREHQHVVRRTSSVFLFGMTVACGVIVGLVLISLMPIIQSRLPMLVP